MVQAQPTDGTSPLASAPAYPFSERPEMLAFVPPEARKVLDVGCGPGGFGNSLRSAGIGRELWAVEVDPAVAAQAQKYYDELVVGTFPDVLAGTETRFDCIVFNDVLEHVVDPWATLRSTLPLLAPGGSVVASIPNVRNVRVVLALVLRGDWTYTDIGIMDRTHLRFFTLKSIRTLFADSGFTIDVVEGINAVGRWSRFPLPAVWRAVLREFAYTGFAVRAVPSVGP